MKGMASPCDATSTNHLDNSPQSHQTITRQQRIEAEITRLLYAQAPVGFLATLLNASILVAVLRTEAPQPPHLYAWLAALVLIVAVRFVLVRAYHRAAPTVEHAPLWRRRFLLGIIGIGVAWGSASFVIFPPDLHDQVFLAFVLGGMSAGAITIMAAAQYAPLGFLLPVLGPLAARFFLQGGDLGLPMSVMVVLFCCGLMLAARQTRAATVETLALRFANLDLLDQITQQAAALTHSNDSLHNEIADHKATMQALQESEQRFRQLAENVSYVCWVMDLATQRILYVNPAYERLWGRSRHSLYEQPRAWLEGVHPEDQTHVSAALTQSSAQSESVQYRLIRPDGSIRWIWARTFPVKNEQGLPYRRVGIVEDITDRKALEEVLERRVQERTEKLRTVNLQLEFEISERRRAEESLRHSEELFRSLIEDASDLIAIMDDGGRLTYVSPSHQTVLGYAPGELLNQNAFDFIHPDDRASVFNIFSLTRVNRNEGIPPPTFRFRHQDGSWRRLESIGKNLPANSPMKGMIINSRDVTERVRLEEEKQDLLVQMTQLQKLQAVGVLAGGIAHDFNNLLTPLLGFGEMLRKVLAIGTVDRENLEKVLQAGQRAKTLVRQLLELSRPSTQSRQPVDLTHEVEESVRELKAIAPGTIAIHTTFEGPHRMVLADPVQIHRILMNLGMNALHALEDEGGQLSISVQEITIDEEFAHRHPPLTPGPHYQLRVQDTGCGMTAEVKARIFDPFFTTKPIGKGTGLGLSVVHGVIASYGGAITVESEPGKGSTFDIYLPCAPPAVTAEERASAAIAQGNGCILCIDDEETVTLVLQHMLHEWGYEVVTAASSAEALALFRAAPERFALVVADPTTPGLTAAPLLQELRATRPQLPIVLCSNAPLASLGVASYLSAATSYLQKPFSQAELNSALQRAFHAEEETRLL